MTKNEHDELIDDSIPPKLSLLELPGLVVSFLWFYRGVFLAAIILLGLYYGLQLSQESISRHREHDMQSSSALGGDNSLQSYRFRDEPTEQEKFDRFVDESLEAKPDEDLGNKRIGNSIVAVESVSSPESIQADPDLVEFRKFLASASPARLIQRSRRLGRDYATASLPVASASVLKRRQISARLRELDLNEEQRNFADASELESLSMMDAMNVQNDFGLPGVREELTAFATKLLDHDDLEIVAKSNLALTMSIGCDLLATRTPAKMEEFLNAYKLRIDSVIKHAGCAHSVARYLLQIRSDEKLRDSVRWIVNDFQQHCENSPNQSVQSVGVWLTKKLVFDDLDLQGILGRMDRLNGFILADIEEFFRRLEQYPQMSPDVFAVGLAIVAKHKKNGNEEEAAELVERIRRLLPSISNAESRQLVEEGLARIRQQVSFSAVE